MIWYDLIPMLVLVWIITAIIEMARLAFAERGDHLPPSPVLFYVWRWFRNGAWLTVIAVAGTGYYHEKLISAVAFALVVGVTSVVLAALDRLVQRLRHVTEDAARPAAG
jgi:hypothetical protein